MGVLFRTNIDPAANQVFITEDNESTSRDFIFMDLNSQNKLDITTFIGGSVKFVTTTETGTAYLNNKYHWLMASHDGSNLRIFYNCGNPNEVVAAGVLDDDGSELHIATDGKPVPTAFFTGYIVTAFIDTVAIVTAQEAKEIAFLPADWQAISGNVFRPDSADTWAFKQGLADDTIYTSVDIPAGLWDVSVTAYPVNASATVNGYSQGNYSKTITEPTTFNFQIDGANNFYLGSQDSVVFSSITINLSSNESNYFRYSSSLNSY